MTHEQAALVLLACAMTSCGGAAAPAKMVHEEASPDGALQALDAAEAQLAMALGGATQGGDAPAQPQPAGAPAASSFQPTPRFATPAPTPPPTVAPAAGASRSLDVKERERDAVRVAGGACVTACAALASMERAADHLCSLAGATDGRCTSG
jgi:hypothetical protein